MRLHDLPDADGWEEARQHRASDFGGNIDYDSFLDGVRYSARPVTFVP